MSLPLTLAIIEGLLVHVAADSYVIPLSSVEECLELTPDRFATTSRRNVIQVQGSPVPLVRLRDIFSLPGPRPLLEQAVVINVGQIRVGLAVDQVIGNHQTVIKSLGNLYGRADCISGATITGDGNVALIFYLVGIDPRCEQRRDLPPRWQQCSGAGAWQGPRNTWRIRFSCGIRQPFHTGDATRSTTWPGELGRIALDHALGWGQPLDVDRRADPESD